MLPVLRGGRPDRAEPPGRAERTSYPVEVGTPWLSMEILLATAAVLFVCLSPVAGAAVLALASRKRQAPPPWTIRLGSRLATVFLILPGLWLSLFVALVVRARLAGGSWPIPRAYAPLPDDLFHYIGPAINAAEMPVHVAVLWIAFLPVVLAPVWFVPLSALLAASETRQATRQRRLVFLVTIAACWWVGVTDPGGLFTWFVQSWID
jgi:hypothetical protein